MVINCLEGLSNKIKKTFLVIWLIHSYNSQWSHRENPTDYKNDSTNILKEHVWRQGGVDKKLSLKEKAKSIAFQKEISNLEEMSSVRYQAFVVYKLWLSLELSIGKFFAQW